MVRENESNGMGGETKRRLDAIRAVDLNSIPALNNLPDLAIRANDSFVGFVRERPLATLGAACAIGYVVGRILRRGAVAMRERSSTDITRTEILEHAQQAMGKAAEFARAQPHLAVAVALGIGWLFGNGLSPRLAMTAARLGSKAILAGAIASGGLADIVRQTTGFEIPGMHPAHATSPARSKKRATKSHTATAIKA